MSYLNVRASSGASTPNQAGFAVGVTSLDLRCEVAPALWNSGTYQALVNQYTAGGGAGSRFWLGLTPDGKLEYLFYNLAGSFTLDSDKLALADGARLWVRVLHNVSAGTVTFYTSSDGAAWVQVGAQATGLATTGMATGGASPVMRIGMDADTTTEPLFGAYYTLQVLVNSVLRVNMSWLGAAQGTGPWLAATGETWTALGRAQVVTTPGARMLRSSSASGASTPNLAGLAAGVGVLDLRVDVAPDNWVTHPLSSQTLLAQESLVGADSRFWFGLNGFGGLFYYLYTAPAVTTNANSINPLGYLPGQRKWVRVVHDISAGTIAFYTGDDGVAWTPYEATQTGFVTTGMLVGGAPAPVRVGSDPFLRHGPGSYYHAVVIVNGSTIVSEDWTNATLGTGPWTAPTGETWTAIGSASVVSTSLAVTPVPLADELAQRAQDLGQELMSLLQPLYQNGVYFYSSTDFVTRGMIQAELAATLANYTTSETLKAEYIDIAIEVVERNISSNANAAGLFWTDLDFFQDFYFQGPSKQSMSYGPSQLPFTGPFDGGQAVTAINHIAWCLLYLPKGAISSRTYARWLKICQDNCDALHAAGNTTFWVNGNYNAQFISAYWLTAAASPAGAQRAKYENLYELGYQFLFNPLLAGYPAWTGYGAIIDVAGSQVDWSDYQVHLVETPDKPHPPVGNTNDWIYDVFTLDILTRLFSVNRDSRIARLINGIANKVETRINTTTWVIDGTGGSRQNTTLQYASAYYALIALIGSKAAQRNLLNSAHILDMWDNSVAPFCVANADPTHGTAGVAPWGLAALREAAERAKRIPVA